MSESKHTPGPWKARRTMPHLPNCHEFEIEAGRRELALVYDNDGLDEPKKLPGEANAHLIAAAPDMLAALKGVKLFAEMQVEDLCAQVQEGGPLARKELAEWSAVLSAITKAEGRA